MMGAFSPVVPYTYFVHVNVLQCLFAFMHLAGTFIQSHMHGIQNLYICFSVHAFPGNPTLHIDVTSAIL